MKATRGEWIKLIAADDILIENCIKDNVGYIQRNPETEMLFSAMQPFLVEHGEEKFFEPVKLSQSFLDLPAYQQFIEIIFGRMAGVAPTLFIAKKIYERLDYYNEEFKLAEDYPFWLKCTANHYRFVSMDKLTVLYRYHSNNTGVAKVANGILFKDRIRIFKYYIDRLLADEKSRTAFVDYYKNNYQSFVKFCTEAENLELLNNIKKTEKITNFYYFLVKSYLLNFSTHTFKSKFLRSISYRLLMYQN